MVRASDVLRRHFATFAEGGVEEAAKHWHPDIEWKPLAGSAEDVHGSDAMRRYCASAYYLACLVRDGRLVAGHEHASEADARAAAQRLSASG